MSVERWGVELLLDSVDVASSLTGQISISASEGASSTCRFEMIPAIGAINLSDYENKSVAISYLTKDANGSTLTTTKRFTGITTKATYAPDSGLLTVEATNDLQGKIESLDRAGIDALIPTGDWSKHVFDDAADQWQYSQDRISTTPAEIHVDPNGALEVVNWTAKVTPDVTLDDSARFGNTLRLSRNTRRDLISKNVINFDFRFTRLRHREITVSFTYTGGICSYLDGLSKVPQKSMIQSATDSNGWTRINDIQFTDLPPTGTYCGGKNFASTDLAATFCLDANWKAARRWAQTVTEEYEITVNAADIETAVGEQAVSESYGVEAVFDARDFESIKEFDSEPVGSVLSVLTDDYQLDADQTTESGRTEMEAAQVVAIKKAKTEILERARRNRVTVESVYDQSITLASTVRVNTPGLVAKGKVASYSETLDVTLGSTGMTIDLAISRHGGSGLATDDPVAPPSKPAQPPETPTPRTYAIGVTSGGKTGDPADNPDWDGFITNAYGGARTDPSNMYKERFVLRMPEIEDTARTATVAAGTSTIEVAVPQDELTLNY